MRAGAREHLGAHSSTAASGEFCSLSSAPYDRTSKIQGNNWGMSAKQIRDNERVIVYASPIWYSNKGHVIRKLRSIQRQPLIKICKGYRTIPNMVANVITKSHQLI